MRTVILKQHVFNHRHSTKKGPVIQNRQKRSSETKLPFLNTYNIYYNNRSKNMGYVGNEQLLRQILVNYCVTTIYQAGNIL